MLDINSFFGGFFDMIFSMSLNDIIDILIVAYIFYKIFMFIKDTRAEQVLKGIVLLFVATQISEILKLHTLYWLLIKALDLGFIAALVIFQPELRAGLEHIGRTKFNFFSKNSISVSEEIFNKKVGVQLGTTADIFLSEKMNDKSITRQKKYLSLVEDLKANKVDAIVMDSLPANEIIKTNSNLKILDKELFEDKYGMVVKKGNDELLDTVNKVLEKLMEEGKIDSWTIEYSK